MSQVIECAEDEYDALARQLHESIVEGQTIADTAKALRLLATPSSAPDVRPSVTWKGADRTAIVLMAPIVDGLCSGCGTKPSRETGSCRCVLNGVVLSIEERTR